MCYLNDRQIRDDTVSTKEMSSKDSAVNKGHKFYTLFESPTLHQ